ncbi:MAG: endonuclease/exonuclease/phosphatase family protein [Clostridia bacterium]|nr:endonuclease/exonuclease/phosphatase family protein [Clostridia bacterium]
MDGFSDKIKIPVSEGCTRVMSFNVRCGEFEPRQRIVPQIIGEYLPDTLGVQECTYEWYQTLCAALPEYEFVGVGRDSGGTDPECGEISGVLFLKEKYSLLDSGTFWLSETPDVVSYGWDASCRRVCTWAVLEEKATGKRFTHVNTHLDHISEPARKYGIELVREKALSFDVPTVVTGDFNLFKGCDLYYSLVAEGLDDTQDTAKQTMYGRTYHAYKGGEEGEPIDYILTNAKITQVSRYVIVRDMLDGQYTSDHYPIYADMIIE